MADDKLMRGLGWLSLGLGIPPLLTPKQFGQVLGVGDAPRHRATAVAVGVQELVAAAGLLGQGSPVWLWYRVGGDLLHIGLLGRALNNHDGRGLERTAAAMAAVVGITGVDVYAAVTRSRRNAAMDAAAATTVSLPAQEDRNGRDRDHHRDPGRPGRLRHVAGTGEPAHVHGPPG